MNVPFLDLRAAYDELKTEIDSAVSRVLSSGWYVLGPEVEGFENEFAAYCNADYCVGVGNGLDALHLALRALDVGPGDELIVPSNTYIATWLAVSQCGATPVPVEPLESTYNIDPGLIDAAITSRTKVILPVHLYGQPADLDAIVSLARRHGLSVLEDAAQSHGARYKGQPIGGMEMRSPGAFIQRRISARSETVVRSLRTMRKLRGAFVCYATTERAKNTLMT